MSYLLSIYIFCLPLIYSATLDDHFFLPKYAFTSAFSIIFIICGLYFNKTKKQNKKKPVELLFLGFILFFAINSLLMLLFKKINPVYVVNEITILLLALSIYNFRRSLKMNMVFDWILQSANLVSIIGIFQYYGIHFILPEWGIRGLEWTKSSPIVYSTLGNPNYMCNFLTPLIPFALYKLFDSKSTVKKVFYFTSFCLMSFAIIVSFSRAGILNLIIGVVLYFIYLILNSKIIAPKTILWATGIFVFLAGGFFLFLFENPLNKGYGYNKEITTLRDRIFKKTGSIRKRLVLWKNSCRLVSRFPVTGIGEGNFPIEIVKVQADYFKSATDTEKAFWSYAKRAHNTFLQKFVDKGIPIGIIFLVFNIYLLIISIKNRSMEKIPFILSFIILLSQGLVSFPLMLPVSAVLYYLIVAELLNFTTE